MLLLVTVVIDYIPTYPLPKGLERARDVMWVTAHRELLGDVATLALMVGEVSLRVRC